MERSSTFTPADLESLMQPGPGPRVSVYLPTHPLTTQATEDEIRYKNLMRQAQELLVTGGMRTPEAKTFLQEACSLLDDGGFWRIGGRGMAVFVGPSGTSVYRVPMEFEEFVVVAERHHVKPLLPLMSGDGKYHLLAFSQSRVRLLSGTRFEIRDVTPPGIPSSLDEALRFVVHEKQAQVHTAGPAKGAGAQRASMFHGHGATERDEKGRILEFFREVDAGIKERLAAHDGPLLLAGVDYLRSIYREANSYPRLLPEGIPGNPDEMEPFELHERAIAILTPHFDDQVDRAAERLMDRKNSSLFVSEIRDVLAAARYSRVDTLFVALDRRQWGRYDPPTGDIDLHDEPLPGDEDLLDRATAHTLSRRGRVFVVPAEKVPGGTAAAALLRY